MKKNIINLRFIAIFLVVLGHSIILYSNDWSIYQTTYNMPILDSIKYVINIFSMPLFISISGYLYKMSKRRNQHTFVKKKIKRILIPYICISLFYLIPIRLLLRYSNYENKKLFDIFIDDILLGNDNGHLWYLPTLFFIFIIMFFLEKNLAKRNYFLTIIFLISSVYYIIPIPIFKITYFNLAFQYYCWFYLGYLIKNYEECLKNIAVVKLMLIVIILTILCFVFRNEIFILKNIIIYISAISWILMLFRLFSKERTYKFIEYVSFDSFGIYLLHSPLTYITYSKMTNCNPIIVIFINFFCFGLLAMLITDLIRILKIKFVIGE